MQNNIFFEDTKIPFIKAIRLELENSFKPKFIGHYNFNDKSFRTKRNDSQIYHKTNSIAFNYHLVNNLDIEFFRVEYNGKFLFISKEYLLKVGKVYEFKHGGAELQIFTPIKEFSNTLYQAKTKGNKQLGLFSEGQVA
jgi:hypothetical protein